VGRQQTADAAHHVRHQPLGLFAQHRVVPGIEQDQTQRKQGADEEEDVDPGRVLRQQRPHRLIAAQERLAQRRKACLVGHRQQRRADVVEVPTPAAVLEVDGPQLAAVDDQVVRLQVGVD
jgi:hypothetical protein